MGPNRDQKYLTTNNKKIKASSKDGAFFIAKKEVKLRIII